MWFALTLILSAALISLHFWWRRKFVALERRRAAEIETAQRRQQQTSVDAKAQQQVLFNSMIEGLLLLDRTQKIYLANRAFQNLFGLKVELRGKTILEALRLHELDDLVKRAQAEGQVFDYELKLPDLSERWLRVNAAVISNSAGDREGTILVFHDLTRLKQLERAREEFVANVSHELRTPLSLIKGYIETLLDGARNNPEVAERFLKIIERNTHRLDLLIQDLLTISALESGRMKLNLLFREWEFFKRSTSFGYINVRDPTVEQRTFRLRFRAQRTASFGPGEARQVVWFRSGAGGPE